MKHGFMRCLALCAFIIWLPGTIAVHAEETPLKVGLPDLPEGCRPAADIAAEGLKDYLTLLSSRLGQPVYGCGVKAIDAPGMLDAGELDFALASVEPGAGMPDGIITILRVRQPGELHRAETVIVAPGQESGGDIRAVLPTLPDKQLAAFSQGEMMILTALAEGMTLDAPDVEAQATARAGAYGATWPPGRPLVDPVEALTRLQNGAAAPATLFITQGRFEATCLQHPEACEGIVPLWRGFVPLTSAYAIRADLPTETRYRLIGIHVLMNIQNPDIFAAVAGPGAEAFEPTEPTAFGYVSTLDE